MTTYERAKAYEHVSQKVKDFFEGKQKMYSDVKQTLEYLFPELAGSEDIRERLINTIKSSAQIDYCLQKEGFKVKEVIAWLEKQGELIEKPTKDQVWDYCSKISREWWQITMNRWNTLTDEEKDKYNQFIGFNDFSDTLMNITAGALFQLRDTGKLEYEEGGLLLEKPDDTPKPLKVINEKQEWSEEDEYYINTILNGLDLKRCLFRKEGNEIEEERYNTQYNWLKSFKNRVQLQQKQEWSEEDEVMLQTTIDTLEDFSKGKLPLSGSGYDIAIAEIEWLKSLKPQSHWKPTDEQMNCFKQAIDLFKMKVNDDLVLRNLNSLYKELEDLYEQEG